VASRHSRRRRQHCGDSQWGDDLPEKVALVVEAGIAEENYPVPVRIENATVHQQSTTSE
jgi:hypothetical protein